MIIKFGKNEWKAIKSNIKHQYSIAKDHQIFYNDDEGIYSEPVLIEKELLDAVDCDYFMIDKNRKRLEEGFIGTCDNLPERFSVVYDLDLFDRASEVILEDDKGYHYTYNYFGEYILSQVKDSFPNIESIITYPERDDDIGLFADFENEDHCAAMEAKDIGDELDIEYI